MILEAIADAMKDFSFMLCSHQVSEGKVEFLKGFQIECWLILPSASLQESCMSIWSWSLLVRHTSKIPVSIMAITLCFHHSTRASVVSTSK